MKKLIKKFYMLIFHPIIFLNNISVKGLFIRRRSNIKCCSRIRFGNNVGIGYDSRINFWGKKAQLILQDGVYVGNRVSFLLGESIYVGFNTILASDVCICSENHGVDPESETAYKDQSLRCSSISIGEGCWIGEKVIILAGVKIGNKCVVGAGSVVTKSIPDYSIAVGNPARIIKEYSFEKHVWRQI